MDQENYASIGTCYTGFSISRSELASVHKWKESNLGQSNRKLVKYPYLCSEFCCSGQNVLEKWATFSLILLNILISLAQY